MADKLPLVSIGMPVFNAEDYIDESIRSILTQTFTDFELIICDNRSTDMTRSICQGYAEEDERIRFYGNDRNLGASKNYNRVFKLASGKYFKWAAHDDIIRPEFLESCIKVLEQNPQAVLCYAKTELIDQHGNKIGTYEDNMDLPWLHAHKRYRKFFKTQGLCNPITGVIRSAALGQTALIGNYPSADRVLMGELTLYGQFVEFPEYLFCRRIHPQTSTIVNKDEVDIATWFDPANFGTLVFPHWKRLEGYSVAILRAPLSFSEKILCFAQLIKFVFFPERWAGLFRDLISGANVIIRKLKSSKT